MLDRIKKLLGKKSRPHDSALAERWYGEKSDLMEQILGKEHDMVLHAMIPYAVGGGLDLYYYPNQIPGVGIATKELSELPRQGSSNRAFECYELAMFTRHELSMEDTHNPDTPFGRAHMKIQRILNFIGPYSAQATLNPNETCAFPAEIEHVGGSCLVFAQYGPPTPTAPFGILAAIEVFPSEVNHAREHGGAALLELLSTAGHYPYSDLDRNPVA